MTPSSRPIVFCSDFGYRNEWVGICHAVMARIAPNSRIVDLSHGVPPLDVMAAARLLADSLTSLASDAVVVSIVDPSVGADATWRSRRTTAGCSSGPTTDCLFRLARSWEESSERWRSPLRTWCSSRLRPHSAHVTSSVPPPPTWPPPWSSNSLGRPSTLRRWRNSVFPSRSSRLERSSAKVIDLNRFGNAQLNVR